MSKNFITVIFVLVIGLVLLGGYTFITVNEKDTIVNEKEEKVHFQSKEWPAMLEDEAFKEYVYQLICDSVIMKYKVNPDEVVVTKGVEGEESGD